MEDTAAEDRCSTLEHSQEPGYQFRAAASATHGRLFDGQAQGYSLSLLNRFARLPNPKCMSVLVAGERGERHSKKLTVTDLHTGGWHVQTFCV
jgi:hypothetical protein